MKNYENFARGGPVAPPRCRNEKAHEAHQQLNRFGVPIKCSGIPSTPDGRYALARAFAGLESGEPWPTNEQLGGGSTGTRDDEFQDMQFDRADEFLVHYLVTPRAESTEAVPVSDSEPEDREALVIYLNQNAKMSRGKAAAHAVHAALQHYGVHPGTAVIVLGGKPRDIESMATVVRDAGRTELTSGTLTAGTNGVVRRPNDNLDQETR
jgi:peptidyl-tRNA hydrolase, PTH2 family